MEEHVEHRTVRCAREGAVATVTLDRPAARNAIDDATREALRAELAGLAADPALRIVILTGAGEAFCAGGDVKAMARRLEQPPGEVALNGVRRQRRTFELVSTLHRMPQVTIAAVNGPAAGLGMDLALACDLIVMAERAWMAASFVDRGLVPDGGSMYFLPRRIGVARAKEMLWMGRRVTAKEAVAMGLADVLASTGAVEAARELAGRFSDKPPAALSLTKDILNRSSELSLEVVAQLGAEAQAICYTTDDHRASVEGFLARRGSSKHA